MTFTVTVTDKCGHRFGAERHRHVDRQRVQRDLHE